MSTTNNYHRFGQRYLLVVGRSERCSLLIALRRQRFSVLSPAAGRRPRHAGISPRSSPPVRWAARSPGWRRARCVASAEIIPPCVYDERPRLPVGLAVGAADQAPRACDSDRGLTGKSARSHVSWLRDRGFESGCLQRRVCELSVPERSVRGEQCPATFALDCVALMLGEARRRVPERGLARCRTPRSAK